MTRSCVIHAYTLCIHKDEHHISPLPTKKLIIHAIANTRMMRTSTTTNNRRLMHIGRNDWLRRIGLISNVDDRRCWRNVVLESVAIVVVVFEILDRADVTDATIHSLLKTERLRNFE